MIDFAISYITPSIVKDLATTEHHKGMKEIADELGISIKTVENQISRALKLVRKAVLDYEN